MPTATAPTCTIDLAVPRHPIRRVSALQLEMLATDPGTRVLDTRAPIERHADGFIAGSIAVPAREDLAIHLTGHRGTVVIVSRDGAGVEPFVAEALRLGCTPVSWLDGGFDAWKRAGRMVAGLASWHRAA